jgi:minor histocompatibility antigen H13
MLGLGDIIIPGLMIGLALRFDLHLFYLRRQKRIPAKTEGGEDIVEKAEFTPLAGRWSDHFWTHTLTGRPLWTAAATEGQQRENEEAPFTFPKTYFNAALVGYVGGLVATFCALHLMNHAQPALLWLVPGVLISLWLTALVRGELGLMWHYSEEIVEEEGKNGKDEKKRTQQWIKDEDETVKKQATAKSHRPEREVFSLSIEAPRKPNRATMPHENGKKAEVNGTTSLKEGHDELVGKSWAGSASKSTATQDVDVEPAGKRLRVR